MPIKHSEIETDREADVTSEVNSSSEKNVTLLNKCNRLQMYSYIRSEVHVASDGKCDITVYNKQ